VFTAREQCVPAVKRTNVGRTFISTHYRYNYVLSAGAAAESRAMCSRRIAGYPISSVSAVFTKFCLLNAETRTLARYETHQHVDSGYN